jgi:hypothetical protein
MHLPPLHPESWGGAAARRPSAGGASQHSGSFQAGTPRTPLSAEYAQALQRNSQRLLEAVASSASSGLGGSAENPVPLPEQETLMLPLAAIAVPGGSPHDKVRVAARVAAEAGELSPASEAEGPSPPRPKRPPAANKQQQQAEAAAADGTGADADADGGGDGEGGAAAADATADPCTCPPFAVKATCGKRPIMEDTYALCPNICELPMPPMIAAGFADKLPQRIAVQLANGEPSAEPGDADAAAAAAAGAAACAPDAAARDGGGGSGTTFGSSVEAGAAIDKLHFFGVYDGHGGIQASQHCAARLHHHLSACLREMATGYLGHAVVGSVESATSMDAAGGAWRAPLVPEVCSGRGSDWVVGAAGSGCCRVICCCCCAAVGRRSNNQQLRPRTPQ